MADHTTCTGCGLSLRSSDGPIHAYVTSSPECWTLFTGHFQSLSERLFTDAYMAQHPDGDDQRQIQSVASHLVALEAVLVRGQPRQKAANIVVAAISVGREIGGYRSLRRPSVTAWPATIQDVVNGASTSNEYVNGVLTAWHATEGPQIVEWTDRALHVLYSGR